MLSFQNFILIITATTTALIAGLFYAWTCSVIPGLARLSDTDFVRAMQSFNIAIQNPLFFLSFMGTAILLPFCTYLDYCQPTTTRFYFLLAATIFYLLGVLAVTIFGNVPLNEELAGFDLDAASSEAIAAQREKFVKPWNRLNMIRTVSSAISIILVIIACLSRED